MFPNAVKNFLNGYGGFLAVAILMAMVVVVSNLPLTPSYRADSSWYVAIAQGHIETVIKPFSSSFLHPFVAGWLSAHFALDLGQAFLLVDIIFLLLFFVAIALILKKIVPWSPFLLLLLPIAFCIRRLGDTFSPDIFAVALTALFFLSLFYEKEGMGLVTLFLLFLTRQSTMLLGLVFFAVTLCRSKKLMSLAALIVIVISVFTASHISNLGLPNAHNLSDFGYLVLRIPFLVLRNLGVTPWVNTLPDACVPQFTFGLPHWSLFGPIKETGFCGFNFPVLLDTVTALFSVFGILPIALFYLLSRKWRDIFRESPRWLLIAMLYGVAHYFFTLGSTTGVPRFVGYGWPAFLLATPFLVWAYLEIDGRFIAKLSAAHLLAVWLPFFAVQTGSTGILAKILLLLAVLALNCYAVSLLKRQKIKAGNV